MSIAKRLWVAALLCVACRPLSEMPQQALRLTPPNFYRDWWQQIEDCSGKRAPFDRVRYYIVIAGDTGFQNPGDTAHYIGYAFDDRNAIVLSSKWAFDAMIVRHEQLHRLASPAGHDPHYYMGRCRSLVSCNMICQREIEATSEPPQL